MMRFQAQQKNTDRIDSLQQQESSISKQASLLPQQPRSTLPSALLKSCPSLVQAHLERIADFLLPGKIWWSFNGDDVEFLDGPLDPSFRDEGPNMHNFRSSSLKAEFINLKEIWETCAEQFQLQTIDLPVDRIFIYINGKKTTIQRPEQQQQGEGPPQDDALQPGPMDIDLPTINTDSTSDTPDIDAACSEKAVQLEQVPEKDQCVVDETIAVDPSTVQKPTRISLSNQENIPPALTNSTNQPKTNVQIRKTGAKRKLFQSEDSHNSIITPCHSSNKKSALDCALQLLGQTHEATECIKYKRLKDKHPSNASFLQKYEYWFVKVQLQVSKKFDYLQKRIDEHEDDDVIDSLKADLKMTRKLLDHWGMYHH